MLDALLATTAAAQWAVFDATPQVRVPWRRVQRQQQAAAAGTHSYSRPRPPSRLHPPHLPSFPRTTRLAPNIRLLQGAFMAALTAVAGPAMEMSLINGLHLYSYQHNAWVRSTPLLQHALPAFPPDPHAAPSTPPLPAHPPFTAFFLHPPRSRHPTQVLGTPSWICWVYACGGPAVGNLGRRVSAELQRQRMAGGGGDAAAAAAAGQRQRQQ